MNLSLEISYRHDDTIELFFDNVVEKLVGIKCGTLPHLSVHFGLKVRARGIVVKSYLGYARVFCISVREIFLLRDQIGAPRLAIIGHDASRRVDTQRRRALWASTHLKINIELGGKPELIEHQENLQ